MEPMTDMSHFTYSTSGRNTTVYASLSDRLSSDTRMGVHVAMA